jgi:hypothetical protein
VITGFNTDIEHEGVTYHVQTEDKGLETPLILSLVYVGGAIIASKRTLYEDLISKGFDENVLTERLQRQHKLICAAIRAGRIEDLKRMGEQEGTRAAAKDAKDAKVSVEKKPKEERASRPAPKAKKVLVQEHAFEEPSPRPDIEISLEKAGALTTVSEPTEVLEAVEVASEAHAEEVVEAPGEDLYLSLLDDEGEFRAGQLATVKIHVGRGQYGQQSVADAEVTVKVLGTTFRPIILMTNTDPDGLAVVRALLPRFTSGRAAIIIRASVGADMAELRRIIHQS